MPINGSPRKVPLNSGDDVRSSKLPSSCTRRAFFCAVVVEGPDDAPNLSEEVSELIQSLGDRLPSERGLDDATPLTPSHSVPAGGKSRPRALTNNSALADLVNELVTTERNYVQRLRLLKELYADPLRQYARSKDTAIIPAYEAKVLFGNIDQIVPSNEAFLRDLEQMMTPSGPRTIGGVGDVALHHFSKLRTFDCYKQYYHKREEAQAIFKREMAKKSSTGFAPFIERIKYSSNDPKSRVGLRELLMEPVQRIPRYTLLFRTMVKLMAENDPQREKLVEANEIASHIATADTDEHTKLAAIMISLRTSIEGFPPALISSSRRFVDCIDVVDNNVDAVGSGAFGNSLAASTSSSGSSPLHCTLFLFDDKLMIVKRPSADKSGRALAGLDDVEKLATSGIGSRGRNLASMKRGGMVCKGVLDITDVNATDVSGTEMHLFLENPLLEQNGRWAGRPFRVLSVVTAGADVDRAVSEKQRFIENLWRVQARYRTKSGQSVATVGDEFEVESKGGRVTIARAYYNIYTRTPFLQEPKKTKVVLHIDSLGHADPLPFGLDVPPHVVVRVQPLPGELCRYTILSDDSTGDMEEDVVQSHCIPERIVHTINQYGLFKFHTNQQSRPATPSGPNRSRAHIFGLDAISRNLFGALPGSTRSKEASTPGSTNSHRRTRSAAISRSSTVRTDTTATNTTLNSSSKFTQSSHSTAATSLSSFAVDDGSVGRKAPKSRKLVKRNRSRSGSPGAAHDSEVDYADVGNESMRRRARSLSVTRNDESFDYSDVEDADTTVLDLQNRARMTESDMNLSMQLALARRNSRNQHERAPSQGMEMPIEETIYEEEPPLPTTRPGSRSSRRTKSTRERDRDMGSLRSPSPQPTYRSITPSYLGSESPKKNRPMGPRPVSPLPLPSFPDSPPTSPNMAAMQLDIEGALESTIKSMSPEKQDLPELMDPPPLDLDTDYQMPISGYETPPRLPHSSRAPFSPALQSTPRHKKGSTDIVPLSIKKKAPPTAESSSSPATSSSNLFNKKRSRSPEEENFDLIPRAVIEFRSVPVPEGFNMNLVRVAESTRDNIEASLRAVKRIKLDLQTPQRASTPNTPGAEVQMPSPSSSPSLTHTPSVTRTEMAKKEVNARMEEMRNMIGARNAAMGFRARGLSFAENVLGRSQSSDSVSSPSRRADVSHRPSESQDLKRLTESIQNLVTTAEDNIVNAASSHARLEKDLRTLVAAYEECTSDLARVRASYENERAYYDDREAHIQQLEMENGAIFQEFNEQLESLFNDVSLPHDEAWTAMADDLAEASIEAQQLRRENGVLQRKLREVEAREARWAALLREHGHIS